jgi:transcriptional regulator with XRE-family HTH domain
MTTASPTVRRRLLAAELRKLRAQHGSTVGEVAAQLGWQSSKLSRIENAQRAATVSDARALLSLYAITEPAMDQLLTLARDARKRGWWDSFRAAEALPRWFETYVGLEAEADTVRTYEPDVVPGLLQTESYARAISRATVLGAEEAGIEQRVELRLRRQERLTGPVPLRLWAVLGEGALRREVGGSTVLAEQLKHLCKMADLPNVVIQVVPFRVGDNPAMAPFTILGFPESAHPDVVYLESPVGGHYLEDEHEVAEYVQIVDHLRAHGLDPSDSARMLQDRIGELV